MFRVPKTGRTEEGKIQGEKTHNRTERNVWEISGCQWRWTFKCVHMWACVCVHVCSDHGLEQIILWSQVARRILELLNLSTVDRTHFDYFLAESYSVSVLMLQSEPRMWFLGRDSPLLLCGGVWWLSQSRSSAHKSAGEWMELVDSGSAQHPAPCWGVLWGEVLGSPDKSLPRPHTRAEAAYSEKKWIELRWTLELKLSFFLSLHFM